MLALALKELRFHLRNLRVVLLILILGFVGPLFSAALKDSVDHYISTRSRQILSADLALSSLREFKPEERREIESVIHPKRQSEETEFVTMARGAGVSSLVQVKAVDAAFPLAGKFVFKASHTSEGVTNSGGANDSARESTSARALSDAPDGAPIAWAFPEVLAQLGLKAGEKLTLGKTEFTIAEVVTDGPGLSGGPGGFAPRLYIASSQAQRTGLLQFGSQVFHRIYLELPSEMSYGQASALLKDKLADPDIFLRTPDDATAGLERFFEFFSLYLISISLIVFALSWASGLYVMQVYLQERLKNSAILMTFGAQAAETVALAFLQIASLLFISLSGAALFVDLLIHAAPLMFSDLWPEGFELKLRALDLGRLALVALATSAAFVIPFAVRLRRLKLHELLGESPMGVVHLSRVTLFLSYSPLIVIFLSLSAWLMNSMRSGLILMGGLIAAVLIGWALARTAFAFMYRLWRTRVGAMRLISTNLARSRFGMNLAFIALLLTTLILNLVPHLLKSATAEVEPVQGRDVPSLFLFNIPEADAGALSSFAQAHGAEVRFLSPMILARLMKVNGRETSQDGFLRYPVRLSYRAEVTSSEKLIEGVPFAPKAVLVPGIAPGVSGETVLGSPENPAAISMEKKFAERNGFHLGDVIEFDMQGVPIAGRVVNFRSVRWSDFHPNFFMIFEPGVLDDAPKTYLANINIPESDAGKREERKAQFQYELIKAYPDLNVIDIGRTLDRVLETVRNILGPVRAAAWIAVAMSFLILGGVIAHSLRLRRSEVDIEKLLGADSDLIRRLMTSEYAIAASFASVLGAGMALGLTSLVTSRLFDVAAHFDGLAIAISVGVTVALTSGLASNATSRVLKLRGTSEKL